MEDLRIRRLVLNEVGVFKHLDVSFPECPAEGKAEIHIFVGENGTGKTTLLEAMTSMDWWYRRELKGENLYGQPRARIMDKFREGMDIRISFGSEEISMHNFDEQFDEEGNKRIVPGFFKSYFPKFPTSNTKLPSYFFVAYEGRRSYQPIQTKVMNKERYDPIKGALIFDKTEAQTETMEWVKDNKFRAALAYQRGNPQEGNKYLAEIVKLEEALSNILDRKIKFVIDDRSLTVQLLLENEAVFIDLLPDGYQSAITWLTDLFFRLSFLPDSAKENFTLFLDEIDIHLHPKAQRRILPVIQKLFPNAQIFITTHSPFVIGSVDDAWVYKFKLDAEGKSVLDGTPIRSEDGHSYRWQLRSFFDTSEQFGIEVEKNLKLFYAERDRLLQNGKTKDRSTFIGIGNELLKNDSIELAQIVHFEMNQVEKILGATK